MLKPELTIVDQINQTFFFKSSLLFTRCLKLNVNTNETIDEFCFPRNNRNPLFGKSTPWSNYQIIFLWNFSQIQRGQKKNDGFQFCKLKIVRVVKCSWHFFHQPNFTRTRPLKTTPFSCFIWLQPQSNKM